MPDSPRAGASRTRTLAACVAATVALAAGVTIALADGDDGTPPNPEATATREPAAGKLTTRWTTLRPSLRRRTEVAAARVGNFVYVLGGFDSAGGRTTAAVLRYDIERNRWTRVRDMPVGLNHAAAAAYKGDVYVLGGYADATGLANETSDFLKYDPDSNRWTRMPRAPTRRGALAAGVIGDRLYAAGGAQNNGQALKRLEIFDFDTLRWSRGPDMAVAREHLAGTAAGGFFYVLAGRVSGSNFTVAERFNPARRRWERLPDMRKSRGGIAAATVSRGRVVVFGGEESAGTIREVELFDPATRRWRRLPDLRVPRHGLGGVSKGNRVYAIEGGDKPGLFFSNALEALDVP